MWKTAGLPTWKESEERRHQWNPQHRTETGEPQPARRKQAFPEPCTTQQTGCREALGEAHLWKQATPGHKAWSAKWRLGRLPRITHHRAGLPLGSVNTGECAGVRPQPAHSTEAPTPPPTGPPHTLARGILTARPREEEMKLTHPHSLAYNR